MVMGRFRRSKSPIRSVKNVVDNEGNLLAATRNVSVIASAVNDYTGVDFECEVGSTINAFFISKFALNDADQVAGSAAWYLAKVHTGQSTSSDFPAPNNVGGSAVRNQIIHQEKAIPGGTSGPGMGFKDVLMIPKGMRRMREGDSWVLITQSVQAGKFCELSIYKWFT